MSKLGKRLINAAKSAQAIAKGEADPKTYKVHVPAHLDVRAIRTKLKMSQNAFAARFGILPSTLRDREQKRRHRDCTASTVCEAQRKASKIALASHLVSSLL
jgi:putative transcriptional regulator